MGIEAVFKKPFAEQVTFFRGKLGNLIPTESWLDVQKSAHDTGFMVAGAAKADLLADLAGAVDEAIIQGTGIGAFRANFDKIVEKHGWSYRGEYNWRTRTIYRTNMASSYSAGRLVQLKSGNFPLWMYRHSDSVARPRPLHVSWDGLTMPPDDPWWQTHYPQNGWGCECYVIGVTRATAERLGGRIESAPDDGFELDGRPKGIDKGWDYQPGATAINQLRKDIMGNAKNLPGPLAAAVREDLATPASVLPAFVASRTVKEAERFGARILQATGGIPYQTNADGSALTRFRHGRTPTRDVPEKVYGKVSYSGMDLDTANHCNKMLLTMQAECDALGIPRLRGIKTGAGRAFASMGDGVMSISKAFSVKPRLTNQKVSEALAGDALASKPYTTSGYFSDVLDQANTTLWHEFAHHIHQQFKVASALDYRVSPPLEKILAAFTRARHGKLVIPSRYGATNAKEFFAESYNLYKLGRTDLLDPDIVTLIKTLERGELP